MPALPPSSDFTTTPGTTQAGFKTAIANLRTFLADLLGTAGTTTDAVNTLWTAIKAKLESVQVNLGGTTRGTGAFTTVDANSSVTSPKLVQSQSGNDWVHDATSTHTGSGPQHSSYYNPATTTNGEPLVRHFIYGRNSTPAKYEYARWEYVLDDKTAATEDASFLMKLSVAGALSNALQIVGTSVFKSLAIYNQTTASAANVTVDSSGNVMRSTSSVRYKTDIEDLDLAAAQNLLNLRPIWYRSKCEGDNAGWSWYGFLAEEVAEIDPRFVSWGYSGKKKELLSEAVPAVEAVLDEDGNVVTPAREGRPEVWEEIVDTASPLQPEGVQYERMVVPLVALVKKQQQQIDAIQARLTALER